MTTPNLDRVLADSVNAIGERYLLATKLRDAVALDIAKAVAEERRAVVAYLRVRDKPLISVADASEIDNGAHITKKTKGVKRK